MFLHFSTLITLPKQPYRPNVKAAAKSSHHEDFAEALTFGWFGGTFLSMSAQKLAILVDPISTFYKMGIVGLAKKVTHTHTQNFVLKLMDTTELIYTRHDRLSFAPGYSKGLSLKLWIFHKRKGSIAVLELLGFS